MKRILMLVIAGTLAFAADPAAAQPVQAGYIYTLSSFTGAIPYNWSRVAVDLDRNEVYVLFQNTVRVFNEFGMEVYRFADDLDLGQIVDVAVDDRGDILFLVYRDSRAAIVRCDYRGRPESEVTLTGVPREFSDIGPNRLVFRRGAIYLASSMGLKIIVADRDGRFTKGYDLFPLFELEETDRGSVELGGFSVDRDGNILMTVSVLFRAFVLSPDGRLSFFGKASSAPGGFNITGGIARDSKGNLLIVDKLKGAVLVFDKTFAFVTQFSRRGYKRGELVYPDDLVIDSRDRVYVTQMGRRGVSVFTLEYAGGRGM
jgi:DNA-binding beta-propeller fold protein YncE